MSIYEIRYCSYIKGQDAGMRSIVVSGFFRKVLKIRQLKKNKKLILGVTHKDMALV